MVDRAILIGVGGSGCKCLESVVHLAAAGLLAADCDVLFVDQDKANECTGRAYRAAQTYAELFAMLERPAGGATRATVFGSRLAVRGDVLQPLPEQDASLQRAYSVPDLPRPGEDSDAWLMRALFNEAERTDDMNNGFRARPAVGAAAYAVAVEQSGGQPAQRPSEFLDGSAAGGVPGARAAGGPLPMWPQVVAALDEAISARPRRIAIVLLGSLFGGTGAAGLPSLGHRLRRLAALRGAGSVDVTAVMMLPYFDVDAPGRDADEYGPVPSGQVRLALEHYGAMMRGPDAERPFDSLRVVGLERLILLPYESQGGGGGQDNAPLVPELIGALGAAHALATPPEPGSVYYCARELRDEISLRDLPMVSASLTPEPALAELIRCGFAYLCAYYPILWKLARGNGSYSDYPFLQRYVRRAEMPKAKPALEKARVYFQALFAWAAALEIHHPGHTSSDLLDPVGITFFSATSFAEPEPVPRPTLKYGMNGAEANEPVQLSRQDVNDIKRAFRGFISDSRGLDMHVVLDRLASGAAMRTQKRGARALIEAIYQASRTEGV